MRSLLIILLALFALFVIFRKDYVPQRTAAVQLVDNASPRTLRLMRRLVGSGKPRFEPVFELTLPEAYYSYYDNHKYHDQSAIGLYIGRDSFEPTASIIARERSISDPHTLITYLREYKYQTLSVDITATEYTPESLVIQEAALREEGGFVGNRWEFAFYHRIISKKGGVGDNFANFVGVGFHKAGNLYVSCSEFSLGCGVEFFFYGAKVHFVLRRHELDTALEYRNRLISFLARSMSKGSAARS